MGRTLIVSNRLPVTFSRRRGEYTVQESVGGVATGLGGFYRSHDCVWIGWPGIRSQRRMNDEEREIRSLLSVRDCIPVFLTRHDIENYYNGFCNSIIWPHFHYFKSSMEWKEHYRKIYRKVNGAFCDAVLEEYDPGDTIWVHDYHLMDLPGILREKIPDATIGFFLHIPFPSYEIYRMLPWRKEILEGLLGADLIGFHCYDYVRHFLSCVRRIMGYEHSFGEIKVGNRLVKADTFPMGINYEQFEKAVHDPSVQQEIQRIRKKFAGQKIILSFDRLDYTKGIPQRLEAFDTFLDIHPEHHGGVVLILVAVPSRTVVREYESLKHQVDTLVGHITGKYRTMEWTPVHYFYHVLPFHTLVALYNIADVALVTPLRDGMNLMAKEYLASKPDGKGVLILSEMAGAACELGEAVLINPFNRDEIVTALERALSMPVNHQIKWNRWMQHRLKRYDARHWADDFLERLAVVKERQNRLQARVLPDSAKSELLEAYRQSSSRLLLLDYDGTLVPFASQPQKAAPDAQLLSMLRDIAESEENELVIISGRDKETLEHWFGTLNTGIIAEHGIWIREAGGSWEMTHQLENAWKEEVRPIIQRYVDQTPGSFLEEKEFSLVWHFRMADPELSQARLMEVRDNLLDLIANLRLEILEGSKVLEVKNAYVDKGRAALRWLSRKDWELIMAFGDDRTDESLFAVLPSEAYSFKIGLDPSRARFNLTSVLQVRDLLGTCLSCTRNAPLSP